MEQLAIIKEPIPERTIQSSRTFNAQREILFKAWSDPLLLAQWWGPKGFTNTFHEFNFTPGGHWRFIMHGPSSGDYKNEAVFLKITAPETIVWDRISQPLFQVSVHFEEKDEKTLLTFLMIFDSVEACEKIRKFAPEANEENFDRLEKVLETIVAS